MKKSIFKFLTKTISLLLVALIIFGQTELGNKFDENKNVTGEFLSIGKEKIRYIQKGAGDDVLLIHGTPGSIEDWNPVLDSLATTHRVTAFDRLGHGYSSKENYDYHLKENAELVKNIIQHFALDSPTLIGHSYGGSTIAQLISAHYNDNLKYVIIDSPLFSYEASSTYKLLSIPLIGKGISLLANYTIAEGQIEAGIRSSLNNQSPSQLSSMISQRKNIWLQPKVLYSKAKESVNYDEDLKKISDNYKDINCDLTIITGSDATKGFRKDSERMSTLISSDTLIILENTGHYIQHDQTRKVLKIIRDKLEH